MMPVFEIETPSGKILTIEAASEAEALAGAQQWHAANRSAATAPSAVPGVVGGVTRGANDVVDAATRAMPDVAPNTEERLKSAIMGGGYAFGEANGNLWRGLRSGIANVAGLPVDLANLALMGAGGNMPVGGSKSIDRALGGFGALPEPTQETPLSRGLRRVGEEVGAAIVPTGGALAAAGRVGVQGARKLSPIARAFVEPAAVAPTHFAGKEAAAALAAGTGAASVNEATRAAGVREDSLGHLAGDIGGALAGVGTVGAVKAIGGKLGEVLNAVRGAPGYVDRVVRDEVTDQILRASGVHSRPGTVIDSAPLVDAIEAGRPVSSAARDEATSQILQALGPRAQLDDAGRAARRVDQVVPGFKESLADRTANPGLAALEFDRQRHGSNSGLFAQRRADNTAAIDQALGRYEPQGNPGAFRSELEATRDQRLQELDSTTAAARDNADRLAAELRPSTSAAQRGATVRGALDDARDAARANTEAAYAAADVSGAPVSPEGLARTLDQVTGGLTEVERGLVPQGLVDRVAGLGRGASSPVDTGLLDASGSAIYRPAVVEPVAMKEATDLRSELLRLQRAALADPRAERGGRNAARVLGKYLDAVDGFISGNLTEAQQAALSEARGAKFTEAETFTRRGDPTAAVLARYEGGTPRVRDENVAASFVDPEAMDRLFSQADTPQVRQAIRDEVLSRGSMDDAKRIRGFVDTYGAQINRFPGLRDELRRAAEARATEASAVDAQSNLIREIGPQGRGTVARYLQYGDENAEKAMRAVVAAKDPAHAADELLSFVGDAPKAVEGARKVFWNLMQKSARRTGETTADLTGAQSWMPRAFKRFIDDPATAAVAERLYRTDPDHWANVKKIAEAIQGVDVRNTIGGAPKTSGELRGSGGITSIETLQSRGYAWGSGRISGTFLLTSLAAVAGRRAVARARHEAIARMLDEALLNPDAAATLLKENNPANRAALARKAKGWLGNEASTFIQIITPESRDDEMKAAILREPAGSDVQGSTSGARERQ
jgi:hypothetical protein